MTDRRLTEAGDLRLLERGTDVRLTEAAVVDLGITTGAARNLTMEGLVATLRRDVERRAALPLLACPKCGEPLDMTRGLAHCPMGHFTQPAV